MSHRSLAWMRRNLRRTLGESRRPQVAIAEDDRARQVFHHENLTTRPCFTIICGMRNQQQTPAGAGTTADTVRSRIEDGGERIWRLADFEGLPFTAVAQALSRLARSGMIQRLGKGLYYRPRLTAFGLSQPNLAEVRSLPIGRKGVFPAGIAAANLLGFTTQNPARIEVATNGSSLPRLIVGKEAIIHTRRPDS